MTRHFLRDDDLTPAEQAEVLDLAAALKADAVRRASRSPGPQHGRGDLRQADPAHPGVVRRRHRRARRLPDDRRRRPRRHRRARVGRRHRPGARPAGAAIVWRTFAQARLEEMAAHAGVPVVNALTDDFHPCQLLADLLTSASTRASSPG